MFSFAHDQGIPLEEGYNVGEHLALYADTSGAKSIYETHDTIPSSYLEYAESYLEDNYPISSTEPRPVSDIQGGMLNGWMYKGCSNGWGTAYTTANFVMPFTWNNTLSSYFPIHVFGLEIFYDRVFFNNYMVSRWSWGWSRIDFCIYYYMDFDDRTSSFLAF